MMEDFYIDEERGIVLVESDQFDPNGYKLIVEYTIEEWENLIENN